MPLWVEIAAYTAIALGNPVGGWKIIETMGLRITTLHANSGAAANLGATTAIFGATAMGAPISTTQAAASSVIGAGSLGQRCQLESRRRNGHGMGSSPSQRRAGIAYGMFWLTQLPTVLAWIVVGVSVIAFGSWVVWAMRSTIHASDIEAELPPRRNSTSSTKTPPCTSGARAPSIRQSTVLAV